jgi:carbon starvation protein
VWFLVPPMLLMLAMPLWAVNLQLFAGAGGNPGWIHSRNLLLVIFALATIVLEVWLVAEAFLIWRKTEPGTLSLMD